MLEDWDFQQNSLDVMKMSNSWDERISQSDSWFGQLDSLNGLNFQPPWAMAEMQMGSVIPLRIWLLPRFPSRPLFSSSLWHHWSHNHDPSSHSNFLLIAPKQLGVADQALEVLLASKHALVDSQGFGYLRVWVAYVMSLEFFFPFKIRQEELEGAMINSFTSTRWK